MKKIVLAMLIITALLSFASCGGADQLERCDDLIEDISVLINDEAYYELYNTLENAEIEKLKAIDLGKPAAKYRLTISEDEMIKAQGVDLDKLSDVAKKRLLPVAASTISSQINIKAGYESTVVSTMFNVGDSFYDKSVKENEYYLYCYDGGVAVVISFAPNDNGVVRAGAYMIINESFVLDEDGDIGALFESFGIRYVTGEKIK